MSEEGDLDEIKRYLPRYLSDDATRNLFDELKQFPANIDKRMYASSLRENLQVFQGDGFRDLLVAQLPEASVRSTSCVVVSNSCDVSPENRRFAEVRILYAPIIHLDKYKQLISRNTSAIVNIDIDNHLADIRKQRISHIFYLPSGQGHWNHEGMVRLDMIQSGPVDQLTNKGIVTRRLFSLSDYGFYLFLLKLSIHFTRIREHIARS